MVQSAQSKIPRNFSESLKNGENRRRLIELIKDVLIANKENVSRNLSCQSIFFSVDKIRYHITASTVEIDDGLSSNQEEADTKLLLHCKHAFDSSGDKSVIVSSPSGDVDVNTLFLSLFTEKLDKIYLDYGTRKASKFLKIASIDMYDEHKSSLIGFHAFTGNDYVFPIFRKSKKACWKVLKKNNRFIIAFSYLGSTWDLDEQLITLLKEYMCNLFRRKKKDIDLVRYEIFRNTYEKKEKFRILHCFHHASSHFCCNVNVACVLQKYGNHHLMPILNWKTLKHMDGRKPVRFFGWRNLFLTMLKQYW